MPLGSREVAGGTSLEPYRGGRRHLAGTSPTTRLPSSRKYSNEPLGLLVCGDSLPGTSPGGIRRAVSTVISWASTDWRMTRLKAQSSYSRPVASACPWARDPVCRRHAGIVDRHRGDAQRRSRAAGPPATAPHPTSTPANRRSGTRSGPGRTQRRGLAVLALQWGGQATVRCGSNANSRNIVRASLLLGGSIPD